MMRVASFDVDGEQYASVAHVDITERVESERRLGEIVDRVDRLLESGLQTLTDARSISAVLERLPALATATEPFVAAWTARRETIRDALEPVGVAGIAIDADEVGAVLATDRPLSVIRSGEGHRTESPPFTLPTAVLPDAVEGEILLPIHHGEGRYGVYCVYTTDAARLSGADGRVLETMTRLVGQSIHLQEQREMLVSTENVHLRFAGGPIDVPLSRLADRVSRPIELLEVMVEDGTPTLLVETPAPIERLETAAETTDSVLAVRGYETADRTIAEVGVEESLVSMVSDRSGEVRSFRADPEGVSFTVAVPSRRHAREVHGTIVEAVDGVDLRATTVGETDPLDRWNPLETVADDLTGRQMTALALAYHGGFFDRQRRVDGAALADTMGIARQTFHEHRRAAERKILSAFFEGRRPTTNPD